MVGLSIYIIVLGVFALAGLLFILAALALRVGHSPVQERVTLQDQARFDYQSARGTAHLKLMRAARDRELQALKQCQSALTQATRRKANWGVEHDRKMRSALEEYILINSLDEIRGIGENLALDLAAYARKHGGLAALRRASGNVSGIGPARQSAIDAWVTGYLTQMPVLLAGDFPGKTEILQASREEFAALSREVEELTAREAVITKKLDRLRAEMKPFDWVTLETFYRALQNPEAPSDDLERYLLGVFAEWEPVPDWFKDIVEGASN